MKSIKRKAACILALAMLLCLVGCKGKTKTSRPDMDALKAAEVGSYIFFGEYEQDNDEATGKEAIEWLVLDKQEDKMLVISRYGLDSQPYNTELDDVTWENCSLRNWLNGTFFEAAFIPEEKAVILNSSVTAEANPKYDTSAGNDTTDKVFLLSFNEVNRYFADDAHRVCQGTPFSLFDLPEVEKDENDLCNWWLRSPGYCSSYGSGVTRAGVVAYWGGTVDLDILTVRPAMWIRIED